MHFLELFFQNATKWRPFILNWPNHLQMIRNFLIFSRKKERAIYLNPVLKNFDFKSGLMFAKIFREITEDERLGVPKCGFYYSSPYKKTTFKAGIEMSLLPCAVILIYKVWSTWLNVFLAPRCSTAITYWKVPIIWPLLCIPIFWEKAFFDCILAELKELCWTCMFFKHSGWTNPPIHLKPRHLV